MQLSIYLIQDIYKVYIKTEKSIKCTEEKSVIVSARKFFERVVNDSLEGIVLNPSNENCAIVFLNKENIKAILSYAHENIETQPYAVKNF